MTTHAKNILPIVKEMNELVSNKLANTSVLHPYVAEYFVLLDKTRSDFDHFIAQAQVQFLAGLYESLEPSKGPLPSFIHRIWLSDTETPFLPDNVLLERVKNNAHENNDFIHFIWCNSAESQKFFSNFFAQEINISVINIDQFKGDRLWPSIRRLILDKKYVLASDLMRIVVLNRYGGIYCDLGITVRSSVARIIILSDITIFLGDNLFFQTSLIAMRAGSALIKLVHAALQIPSAVSFLGGSWTAEISAAKEVDVLAGPGFTALLLLFVRSQNQRIFVTTHNAALIDWQSSASWYPRDTKFGETKFGNAFIPSSALSLIDEKSVIEAESLWISSLLAAKNLKSLAIKIRIILGLGSVFDADPTRLQRIMTYYGSDKGNGDWHNYAYFYEYVFPDFVGRELALLEIGIGTNNPDLPSTMGAKGLPGASLRGWREYFSPRRIIGADIDRDILFSEINISTHYVDQKNSTTLVELWRKLATGDLFLVIDDGLHEFEANVLTLETAMENIPEIKIFVIEDVLVGYVDRWKSYLHESRFDYIFIDVPNINNKQDNKLIFIAPGMKR